MISSPALEYIEGLPFRLIEELNYCESTQKVRGRFSGVVLRVIKDEKFSSFVGKNYNTQFLMEVPLLK